jgi:hypothetical protein
MNTIIQCANHGFLTAAYLNANFEIKMKTTANVSFLFVRITAEIEIILGVVIWFGVAGPNSAIQMGFKPAIFHQ